MIGNLVREQELQKSPVAKFLQFLKTFSGMRPSLATLRPKITKIANSGAIFFGQIIAHDTGSRYTFHVIGKAYFFLPYAYGTIIISNSSPLIGENGAGMACCSKGYINALPQSLLNSNCLPIDIPIDDDFYSKFNQTCLNFIRAIPSLPNDCKIGANELMNGVSSYLDLTILYGDILGTTNSLRTLKRGLMKINEFNVLPEFPCGDDTCFGLGNFNVI